MKAVLFVVLLCASAVFAETRAYLATGDNIQEVVPGVYRFCMAPKEHPTGEYTASLQFAFEKSTPIHIDWNMDGAFELDMMTGSPYHTIWKLHDSSSQFDKVRFEQTGLICGDVKAEEKLTKVTYITLALDNGSMTKVSSSFPSACSLSPSGIFLFRF